MEFAGETMDTCLSGVFLLLDSPLAMCHAARWLAGGLGYDPGATAPVWWTDGKDWVLEGIGRDGLWIKRFPVTDPDMGEAEALAAALVAMLEATR